MMVSSYYPFLFVLLSLKPLALSEVHATTDDLERQDYPPCYIYKALATDLLENDRNFYSLQNVFFSPNSGSVVFVTVTYHYEDNNASSTAIFFWSSAVYFFFHPVRIFQFTSLLFSDPALRFDKVDLYLPSNYSSTSSDCMVLLTQRLQLYAMYQKVKAPVDSTYTASAHSADTLKSWYDQNHVVGNLALSSQVLFPLFITVYVSLFLFFILELKPYNLSKKLQNGLDSNDSDVRAKADSSLLTKFVASTLFHLFTLSLDITALGYYKYLPKEIKDYYSYPPRRFWAILVTMTVFDSITFVTFICLPPLVVACCCKKRSYLLIYSLISPLSCIASHSYHIVFAFIIDPYHATSILLVYAIIAFVHILTFQKLFYYINTLISGVCSCCQIKNRCGRYCLTIVIFSLEFTLMAASIALSITLIMMLPFSNALDDAPNHLYVIYQASIAFFAALIAFQVLFRQTNSTFDVFIKAIDGHLAKSDENKKEGSTADHGKIELKNRAEDHTKTGMELSETEKDTVLAKVVLSYLNKGIDFTEEIDLVFQQRDSSPQSNAGGCQECFSRCRKKKESNSSSAQLKAGGDSLQVEKQKGENDSDSNAAGCFSRCRKNKEKQQGDHGSQQPKADGHSPKVKGKDQHGNSDLAHSSAGGCFSCCCRKTEQSLLKEEH